MERQIVTDARKVAELFFQIETDGLVDVMDKCPDAYFVSEAEHSLSKYENECVIHWEEIQGEHGEESRKTALKERRQLRWFLKKWSHISTDYSYEDMKESLATQGV